MVANSLYINIFLTCMFVAVALAIPKINFKECLVKDDIITAIIKTSLEKCIRECVMKLGCLSLNYRRHYQLCELFAVSSGTLVTNNGKTGPCIHILRSNIEEPQYPTDCTCNGKQTCLPESGLCAAKECPELDIPNVIVHGNMKNVEARVKVTCASVLYMEESGRTRVQCQSNGTWDYVPKCISRYLGCYSTASDEWNPIFTLTLQRCVNYCDQYKYAVAKFWTCNCMDTLDGYLVSSEEMCNHDCPGNTSQTCGGYYSHGLYQVSVYILK